MKIKTIEGKETKYDYNYDEKLVKITLPDSNTVQLMYDLIGRMTGVKTKNKNSRIVWDKERIIWESDSVSQTKNCTIMLLVVTLLPRKLTQNASMS